MGPQAVCSEPEQVHQCLHRGNAAAKGLHPGLKVGSKSVRSAPRHHRPPFPGARAECLPRHCSKVTAPGRAVACWACCPCLPGGGCGAAKKELREVCARGWTRTRQWLRVAPLGFIGRNCGHSSHKRQLSERRALIGSTPLTHRPSRTVQHFFTPSPLLLEKKKRERESEIEEEDGEFGKWVLAP